MTHKVGTHKAFRITSSPAVQPTLFHRWHTKLVPTWNLESLLPCRSANLTSQKSQTATLQLVIRPCTFWKYFSTHDATVVLTYWQFLFTPSFSSCSHETYLPVSPACNKFNSGGLQDLWGFSYSLPTSSSAVIDMFAVWVTMLSCIK
jgi:hypothetical protein